MNVPPRRGPDRVLLLTCVISLLALGMLAGAPQPERAHVSQESPIGQILRASDWKGGMESSDGECSAASGEYSYWVYATATRCGVPRAQADRVVSIRQPVPGMAPLTAKARLPGGRYAVWVYGAGQSEGQRVHLCAKTCVIGPVPATPGWAFIDWIELRDNQMLFFRTYQQPEGQRVDVQAVMLSSSDTPPDWVP